MSQRKESITLGDGRNAERLMTDWETIAPITYQSFDGTTQEDSECGVQERVLELHVEKPREKYLQERVIERRRPVVYERETQLVDIDTNEIVETKVESIEDSGTRLKTVEHLGVAPKSLKAQSVEEDDCVTKSDLITAIREVLNETLPARSQDDYYYEDDYYDGDDDDDSDLHQLQAYSEASSKSGLAKTTLTCLIAGEIAAIAYFAFFW